MRRVLHLRLPVVTSVCAFTAAAGVVLAPAASADPLQAPRLPAHVATIPSSAPGVLATVAPFGRKIT